MKIPYIPRSPNDVLSFISPKVLESHIISYAPSKYTAKYRTQRHETYYRTQTQSIGCTEFVYVQKSYMIENCSDFNYAESQLHTWYRQYCNDINNRAKIVPHLDSSFLQNINPVNQQLIFSLQLVLLWDLRIDVQSNSVVQRVVPGYGIQLNLI